MQATRLTQHRAPMISAEPGIRRRRAAQHRAPVASLRLPVTTAARIMTRMPGTHRLRSLSSTPGTLRSEIPFLQISGLKPDHTRRDMQQMTRTRLMHPRHRPEHSRSVPDIRKTRKRRAPHRQQSLRRKDRARIKLSHGAPRGRLRGELWRIGQAQAGQWRERGRKGQKRQKQEKRERVGSLRPSGPPLPPGNPEGQDGPGQRQGDVVRCTQRTLPRCVLGGDPRARRCERGALSFSGGDPAGMTVAAGGGAPVSMTLPVHGGGQPALVRDRHSLSRRGRAGRKTLPGEGAWCTYTRRHILTASLGRPLPGRFGAGRPAWIYAREALRR